MCESRKNTLPYPFGSSPGVPAGRRGRAGGRTGFAAAGFASFALRPARGAGVAGLMAGWAREGSTS